MYVCMYVCMYMYIHTNSTDLLHLTGEKVCFQNARIEVCMHVLIHRLVCMFVHACIYVCMYVCICIYTQTPLIALSDGRKSVFSECEDRGMYACTDT